MPGHGCAGRGFGGSLSSFFLKQRNVDGKFQAREIGAAVTGVGLAKGVGRPDGEIRIVLEPGQFLLGLVLVDKRLIGPGKGPQCCRLFLKLLKGIGIKLGNQILRRGNGGFRRGVSQAVQVRQVDVALLAQGQAFFKENGAFDLGLEDILLGSLTGFVKVFGQADDIIKQGEAGFGALQGPLLEIQGIPGLLDLTDKLDLCLPVSFPVPVGLLFGNVGLGGKLAGKRQILRQLDDLAGHGGLVPAVAVGRVVGQRQGQPRIFQARGLHDFACEETPAGFGGPEVRILFQGLADDQVKLPGGACRCFLRPGLPDRQ